MCNLEGANEWPTFLFLEGAAISLLSFWAFYFSRKPNTSLTRAHNMSIVPIGDRRATISAPFSSDTWDPFEDFPEGFLFSLDLWNPFTDFPSFSREIFPSFGSQISWKETSKAHVYKAFLPGLTRDEVIVYIDEGNVLQISSNDDKFLSRFKLPENAMVDQVQASMDRGVLTVSVGKRNAVDRNVRVVEITGDDD